MLFRTIHIYVLNVNLVNITTLCASKNPTDYFPFFNQSINQTSIAPISPAKPGSVAQQLNQCSTLKSRKQFGNINRPWGMLVSMGERPSQRDVSSDVS